MASPFHSKARQWVKGRKNWESRYEKLTDGRKMVIWFHCASLGEFEMARPVIENFSNANEKEWFILVSFFSPSGFEIQKNYKHADAVIYLPLDTKSNALNFVQLFNPDIAVFVKYEIWLNYFDALKTNGSTVVLMNAVFNEDQRFFKWYGGIFRKALKQCDKIFVQDGHSADLLKIIDVNAEVIGDTRFDRVLQIKDSVKQIDDVKSWAQGNFVVVAGSTWPMEEKVLSELIPTVNEKIKWIIAPHDVSPSHVHNLHKVFPKADLYSQFNPNSSSNVLIIDSIGKLSQIYSIANAAIIGGGFTGKLHNVLEPAVYGIPVYFGPKFSRFNEAKEMIAAQTAFSFSDAKKLSSSLLNYMYDSNEQARIKKALEEQFERSKGAVAITSAYLQKNS